MFAKIDLTQQELTEKFGIPLDVAEALSGQMVAVEQVGFSRRSVANRYKINGLVYCIQECDGIDIRLHDVDFEFQQLPWNK